MKHKRRFALYLPLLLTAFLFVSSGETFARGDDFSALSVKGAWGFTLNGTFLPSANFEFATPVAAAGIVVYDGEGGCTVSTTVNLGGAVITSDAALDCSYDVDPSGKGTQVTTLQLQLDPTADPLTLTFLSNFVIVEQKNELPFILSEIPPKTGEPTPIVATGTSKKISQRRVPIDR